MKEAREENKKKIDTIVKNMKKNYMECHWFASLNMVFFLVIILAQLLQSMSFNGILDIPTLLLIIFMNAFFGFRKSYATFYARFTFFFVFYLTFLIYVKVGFNCISEIGYVR